MIRVLERRARKARLLDRVDARAVQLTSMALDDVRGGIDFGFAFAVVHEKVAHPPGTDLCRAIPHLHAVRTTVVGQRSGRPRTRTGETSVFARRARGFRSAHVGRRGRDLPEVGPADHFVLPQVLSGPG